MQTIKEKFEALQLIKVFEIPVRDMRTGEGDYILFDIRIERNQFIASHVGLTQEQEQSDKVAFVSSDIDEDFSLDENLQALHELCVNAIIDSEFYRLR
jgi:hypothetical protein